MNPKQHTKGKRSGNGSSR